MVNDFVAELVWRIGWTLAHSLWQVSIIGALTGMAIIACSARSAGLRYWIASLGLASCYVPVVATFVMVTPPSVVTSNTHAAVHHRDRSPAAPASVFGHRMEVSVPVMETQRQPVAGTVESERASAVVARTVRDRMTAWFPFVVAGWGICVLLISLVNLGGWFVTRRIRTHGRSILDESVTNRMLMLKKRMNISKPVQIMESSAIESPAVIGWLRPVILLPPSLLTGLSFGELDAILAHELAHIRRQDYLVNLIQTFTSTLLFYHPVVWYLSSRIRCEREYCCDDEAIVMSGNRTVYVQAMSTIEQRRAAPQLAMGFPGRGGSLTMKRIRRILQPGDPSSPTWPGNGILVTLAACLALSGLCGSRLMASADQAASGQAVARNPPSARQKESGTPVQSRQVEVGQIAAAQTEAGQANSGRKPPGLSGFSAPISNPKGLNIGFAHDPGQGHYDGVVGTPGDVWNFVDIGTTAIDYMRHPDATGSTARLRVSRHDGEWGVKGHTGIFAAYIYHNCRCVDLEVTILDLEAGRYRAYVYAHGDAPDQNAKIELKVGTKSYGKKATLNDGSWDFRSKEFREGCQYVVFEFEAVAGTPVKIVSHRDGSGYSMFNAIQLMALDKPRPPTATRL
ncbi:MAG: M56 family metallopeptidase [Fuerstiella sp.]